MTFTWIKDQALHSRDWSVRNASVQSLNDVWQKHPDTLLILKICSGDEDSMVRYSAIQALKKSWKDDAEIMHLLVRIQVEGLEKK